MATQMDASTFNCKHGSAMIYTTQIEGGDSTLKFFISIRCFLFHHVVLEYSSIVLDPCVPGAIVEKSQKQKPLLFLPFSYYNDIKLQQGFEEPHRSPGSWNTGIFLVRKPQVRKHCVVSLEVLDTQLVLMLELLDLFLWRLLVV